MDNEPGVEANPLVFRGRLSENDALDLQRCHDLLVFRRSIRWLGRGVAALVVVLCLAFVLVIGPHVVPVLMLAASAYLLFGLRFERAWQIRRHYRRNAARYYETQVALSADRVTFENEAIKSEFRWEVVGIIADAPAGLLFCNTARQVLFWLPARLFEGNRLREQALALAERNGVRVQRLAISRKRP